MAAEGVKPTLGDVQRAHDLLNAVISEQLRLDNAAEVAFVKYSLHVLCWLLGHGHNRFAPTLAELERKLNRRGHCFTPPS
jgi:hypothetical protein